MPRHYNNPNPPTMQQGWEALMEALRRITGGNIAPFNTPAPDLPDERVPGSAAAAVEAAVEQFLRDAGEETSQAGQALRQLLTNTGEFLESKGLGNGGLGNPNAPGMSPPPPPPSTGQGGLQRPLPPAAKPSGGTFGRQFDRRLARKMGKAASVDEKTRRRVTQEKQDKFRRLLGG